MITYIDEVADLKGTRVLLRLDLNVPVENGQVVDDYRIQRVIETIDFLRAQEAQTIIIAHCEGKDSTTLVPVWHYLNGFFPVEFCPTYFTPESIDKLLHLENKGVLLFENVRINEGEKKNDPEFAKKLAAMADVYVGDAFSVCHREHASIVGVPKLLPRYGGLLLRQEIRHLSKAFSPIHPFVFILGGAKFDTKLPLITKYLDVADSVFVGGALANNIFKQMGYEVGTSLVAEGDFGIAEMLKNEKLIVPSDVTVTKPDGSVGFVASNAVAADECIVDSGPETLARITALVSHAQMVVWNGPLGNFEIGFRDKTEGLAEIIADATKQNGAQSLIGGGDTLSAIKNLHLEDSFTFVSTGGGAMLDYLVHETLPGIDALAQ